MNTLAAQPLAAKSLREGRPIADVRGPELLHCNFLEAAVRLSV